MVPEERPCFAEIITKKSPVSVEFFHQRDTGPVLLAHSWDKYVTISALHFPQLESDVEEFTYENLTDIEHGPSITKIAWSPKTSMLLHPVGIIFATVGLDFVLRLVNVDNKMRVSVQTIGEHSSFINDCSFEPLRGNEIASVGDDKKCRVWNINSCELEICIPLTSPGRSVKWNPNDPNKLLVAEQNGHIRLYETTTFQPLLSLTCLRPSSGLVSADWSILNPLRVGAVIGKEWLVWDISKGSLPSSTGPSHLSSSREFRWSNASSGLFSTRGSPDNQAKIYSTELDQVPVSIKTKIGSGMSWHNLLPICAIGGNRQILLYDMEML